ncbi:hypothetical protein [Propylenella binzhouense]|uniref:hypothetical protein n=1 Tax=Propylenella binzhouense TaxID=2555902 RepID=UPI003CCE35B7
MGPAVDRGHGRTGKDAQKLIFGCHRAFCGRPDQHPYELFLQLADIGHRTTRVKRSQSNGIVERLDRALLDEHFRVEGRRTWFETIEEMQAVLDTCRRAKISAGRTRGSAD